GIVESGNFGSGSLWGVRSQTPWKPHTWLRSSSYNYAGYAYYPTDTNRGHTLTNNSGDVRPAIHLNLKKAQDAAEYIAVSEPSDMSITYDGNTHDIGSIAKKVINQQLIQQGKLTGTVTDEVAANQSDTNNRNVIKWYDGATNDCAAATADANGYYGTSNSGLLYKITSYKCGDGTAASDLSRLSSTAFEIKDAGIYTVECILNTSAGRYRFRSIANGTVDSNATATRTFTITVKQCEVKYNWANTGLDSSWGTTFAQTFTPATGTSAAPWVYLNYTLPVTADNTASGGSGGTTTNDKLPYVLLTFTGTQSRFADYKISDIDNVRSTTSKGSDYPKHADTYTVSFTDKNAKTSNYKLVADTGESSTRQYIIERLKVDVPTAPAALTYNGADQSFSNVAKFDYKFITYGQM
ncbi:MAG: hypothetical protein K2G26_02940, partial [Clostridia bacterium]|nr:hypothetical protein [Clostridia bacterium]